jgi:D-amino-acid oxidase
MTDLDVLVVGAGVCGLTTAITLAEAGLRTRIRTAALPRHTTSVAAGAVLGPVLCGPPERVRDWTRTGLAVLCELAAEPATGIRLVTGREVVRHPAGPPAWTDVLPGGGLPPVRRLDAAELPPGFVSGWEYTTPLATMPVYLDYLTERYSESGGSIELSAADSLDGIQDAPVIVNCTGVGARELVPDPAVVPVRGQVVIVRNPGITEFYIDHSGGPDYTYLFPHGDTVLLGGTAEEGAWDLSPRPDITERIVADAAKVYPLLREAGIVAERVGLRPYRPQVRLEAEALPGGRVVWHNYGHGGGGISLSWGCAREISSRLAGQPARPG